MTGLRWKTLYRESELYRAAVRLYTKPLFNTRKALSTSCDGRTLYDFARHGLRHLEGLHRALHQESFHFRPGLALHHNFNGKQRTLYVYPWEERLVDLLLYRLLNRRLHPWFSSHSYAYRDRTYGLDRCQKNIARMLAETPGPLYVVKRDIANYFPSVHHATLLEQLGELVSVDDYLYRLLQERIAFPYRDGSETRIAGAGIPFGTATAALFANIYLTPLDRCLEAIDGLTFYRYGDDLLLLSPRRDAAQAAAAAFNRIMERLQLRSKASHHLDVVLSRRPVADDAFAWTSHVRHLGLEFRADGSVGLSRDKFRKIRNLFRFSFRRYRTRLERIHDVEGRARLAIELANRVIQRGVRNVAIIDYYLRHVTDVRQLRLLDRWLAEEVLSIACGGGHRKGHFRTISFGRLRAMGLPSLVHRRSLIGHGRIESPFFAWKNRQGEQHSRETAARPRRDRREAFSPCPEAADATNSVREGVRL